MIVGPISVDGRQILWAEYHWPKLAIMIGIGENVIPVKFRCTPMQAAQYLHKLDPWVQLKSVADAVASSGEVDDSAEENENARDDLGTEVGKYMGFVKTR